MATDALSALACAVVAADARLAEAGGGRIGSARVSLRCVAGAARQAGVSAGVLLGGLPLGIGVQVLHGVETEHALWLDCELRQVPGGNGGDGKGTAR